MKKCQERQSQRRVEQFEEIVPNTADQGLIWLPSSFSGEF